eukprot:2937526-Ditylum_brightwellii.AAC.1
MNTLQDQIRAQTKQAASSQGTFQEFIVMQPDSIKWLLGTLHAEQIDPFFWIQALNDDKVMIVTDGSETHRKGYFALVFHIDNKTICFQGPCNDNPSMAMPYRMELTEIILALYLIQALTEYSQAPVSHPQTLLCNNISAVHHVNTPIQPGIKFHIVADFDVIQDIMDVKQQINGFTVSW